VINRYLLHTITLSSFIESTHTHTHARTRARAREKLKIVQDKFLLWCVLVNTS